MPVEVKRIGRPTANQQRLASVGARGVEDHRLARFTINEKRHGGLIVGLVRRCLLGVVGRCSLGVVRRCSLGVVGRQQQVGPVVQRWGEPEGADLPGPAAQLPQSERQDSIGVQIKRKRLATQRIALAEN
jgi:hypothetical protein